MENSILTPASTTLPMIHTNSDEVIIRILEQYQQKIMKLRQKMQKVLNLALEDFHLIDSHFQPRILIRLRSEATNKLDALKMPQERKSYLLHQLANCHVIEDLIDLIREINNSQLSQLPIILVNKPEDSIVRNDFVLQAMSQDKNLEQDLLLIIQGPQGLRLAKQSFSLLAAKLETMPAFTFELKKKESSELTLKLNKTSAFLQMPEASADGQKESLIQTVQETIAQLPALGIRRAGLDQKISQLTEAGLLLDPRGLILTDGHHLLSGLIFQQALKILKQRNIHVRNTTLGVLGILDPRVNTTTLLLSDHVKKVILFHHTPIDLSLKLQNKLSQLLSDISQSEEDSPVVEIIRHLWKDGSEILSFLSLPLVREVLQVSSDLTLMEDVQISLSIPSPLTQLLQAGPIKSHALGLDLSAPYKVRCEQNSMSLAEAELSLLSEQIYPRRPLKNHILLLSQLAQAQRFELTL